MKNTQGKTTPPKVSHLQYFCETSPDITIPANFSCSDSVSSHFHLSSFIVAFATDLEAGMTAVFPIALQHFISRTHHLAMRFLVTHFRIIKLNMEGVVDDCLLSDYPECLSKAVGRRHKLHFAVICTVSFTARLS